ncbi:hypothetical protein [Nostoc parmelioides]|uniref:Cyanovirin-N domain-containing protein n=1 Tax=Nostoc parmelioides FACHB-3921 TaxID=2692909 RepID=A0ABR8BQN0_9NOSO|nr:hypothetical protein [Nostoc parmelioides]MBD2255592.1 hypothetical protein [Nostoc parmelioides FACHB-3921]
MKFLQSLGIIGIILVTSFIPKQVLAGYKLTPSLTISTQSRKASGALGTVRNSSNNVDYIGCGVFNSGNSVLIKCTARNSATLVTCLGSGPALLPVVQSLNSDSYLSFSWDELGQCTSISVSNFSSYEPKLP